MTSKILYQPQEGTTGFWGLTNVPEFPNRQPGQSIASHLDTLNLYDKNLSVCMENKLEIVNYIPGIVSDMRGGLWHSGGNQLKPGDIFDLPQGYTFEKGIKTCHHQCTGTQISQNICQCAKIEVLRLVKSENSAHSFTEGCDVPEVDSKPVSESQSELFSLVYRMMDQGGIPEDYFTITRKPKT